MNQKYFIYIFIAVVVIAVAFLVKNRKDNTSEEEDDIVASYYYRYGGDLEWIQKRMIEKKFTALVSMLSCKTAEESDFRIDIIDKDSKKHLNVYGSTYSFRFPTEIKCIAKDIELNTDEYANFIENAKETYVFVRDRIRAEDITDPTITPVADTSSSNSKDKKKK